MAIGVSSQSSLVVCICTVLKKSQHKENAQQQRLSNAFAVVTTVHSELRLDISRINPKPLLCLAPFYRMTLQ